MKRVWVFCDGSTGALETKDGAVGGSGPRAPLTCGAGAVALDADGRIVGWDWRPLPPLTNNEAEYAGLLLAIGLARRLRAAEAIFLLDSEIVVGQMTGRCAVNSRALHRWHRQACMAARELPAARYIFIPREWNRLADGLAAQAGISWAWLRERVMG
ncbi:MAG: ribonuclease HI family protein [Anaerolineae bacterium]